MIGLNTPKLSIRNSKMERILHVLGTMDRGGTESMLMSHYRYIDRTKMQFDFVVHTKEHCDFEDEIVLLGGRVLRLPRFNVINIFSYRKAWDDLFSSHPEYKVIHVHHFLVGGIILPIASSHHIDVRIIHSHNTKPPIFILKEKVMWLFHRNLIKYSTLRLACSSEAGKYLFGNAPFEVFRNAIDVNKFRYDSFQRNAVREELGLDNSIFIVGHVGSFRTRQKNHSFLIDVFFEIQKYKQNARLLLVGAGGLLPEIRSKAENLGILEKVLFVGVRKDIPALLSAMDVFVFPSFFEGLGIVGIEAQASGLPCVFSEAIPHEADITNNIHRHSLAQTAKEWASTILNIQISQHRDTYADVVLHSCYDVESNVKKMYKYYGINL